MCCFKLKKINNSIYNSSFIFWEKLQSLFQLIWCFYVVLADTLFSSSTGMEVLKQFSMMWVLM